MSGPLTRGQCYVEYTAIAFRGPQTLRHTQLRRYSSEIRVAWQLPRRMSLPGISPETHVSNNACPPHRADPCLR